MSTNFFLSALVQLLKKMQFEVMIGRSIIAKPHLCVNSWAIDFHFYYTLLDLKIFKYWTLKIIKVQIEYFI